MKFDYKKILPRYRFISYVLVFIAIGVIGRATYVMSAKKNYWMEVADRVKQDSVKVEPARGNILSCDGEVLAATLPEFKIFMDFEALHEAGNDSLWDANIDSICNGLHQIFPERSAEEFKANLAEGRTSKKRRYWAVWPKRIDYTTYCEVKKLPVFRLKSGLGGFSAEQLAARENPYGSLAGRTVGDMYRGKDEGRTPRCGLELSYDSLLRGTPGIVHRRKVLNQRLSITDTPPIDGCDIVTTIDVGIQDLAERALLEELQLPEVHGDVGVAIVMEVKTGDIKAIVNMEKCSDGVYREIKNHAVSDLLEPGSVFKPISIMTALQDGVCDTNEVVETGNGVWPMYGREMRDHNWRRGGYGTMRLPMTLKVSSNIGVSRIIDKYYHNDPERFVRGVYRSGITADLHIPIVGSTPAKVRMPKKNKRGEWVNWSNTALPWMSIGYETQVPPISTLTFYNAIANGGKMMQPRFVKAAVKDGEVVEEFPPVVVKGHEQIASPEVIKEMQEMLTKVVSEGLGRKAGSDAFPVAGKTGTAQISHGAAGYKNGGTHYLLSFAGFFPADNPRYSCIVCIQKSGLPASGGGMSGVVFHNIAEGIMAQDVFRDISYAQDTSFQPIPSVKNGNIYSADYILASLNIPTHTNFSVPAGHTQPVWGTAQPRSRGVALTRQRNTADDQMPDVAGMGARDAVYLVESRGMKCIVRGRGKVVQQSVAAGQTIHRGQACILTLQ